MKRKKYSNSIKKAGLPPETLMYTGDRKPAKAEMEILVFDEKSFRKEISGDIQVLRKIFDKSKINLIIVNNLTDIALIENLGEFFAIHPLVLEDVLNTAHLPKIEESGEQLFLSLKMLDYSPESGLVQQHISMLLGENVVMVFKDFENSLFTEIKARLEAGKSKARHKKADYLFYLLTDTLVDRYYNTVNEINNEIDMMEIQLLEMPDQNYIRQLYRIKQDMSEMRGVIYPIREILLNVVQGDYSLIEDETITYLQDVRDHINHIIHMFEICRDTLSDLIELNSSNINNRLNSNMKMLTIITTIFIPLTLIAGIYGMNFKHIPELGWKFGYPFSLGAMVITAGVMYYIIKRKKLF